MSIEVAAPPSPQPKAASAGLRPSSPLEAGPQGGASVDGPGSFSTLLAASTNEMSDPEPTAAQDAAPDAAKEDSPLKIPAVPPALDLAALLALAGQAEAVRASADAAASPTTGDGQTGRPTAHRATVAPEEAKASVLGGSAPGAAVKGPLQAGKAGATDPQSVTPDPADSRQSAASVARAAEKLETQGVRLEVGRPFGRWRPGRRARAAIGGELGQTLGAIGLIQLGRLGRRYASSHRGVGRDHGPTRSRDCADD